MDQFAGVWRLIRCESRDAEGQVREPFGPHPVGRIVYDRSGRMSAQLMNPDREGALYSPAGGVSRDATEEDVRRAVGGYVAYFGTFSVDETKGVVIHHVQCALDPSWVGGDQVREYEFDGDRLTLSAGLSGRRVRLTWEREAGDV
jgi:hypothetical protein